MLVSMSEPDAPDSLPKYLCEGVQKQNSSTLRDLAEYATKMADWMEAEAERELKQNADQNADTVPDEWKERENEWEETLADAREQVGASSSATLTTKTIDGRDYYYLQWRDGDSIQSKYVAPVMPAGNR